MAVIDFTKKQRSVEFAHKYLTKGIALTLVRQGTKRPEGRNWQEDVITDPDDASQFRNHNIGFILGSKSWGLTDIDLDCKEARVLARYLLPDTPWKFGRKSNPRSHYLYQSLKSKTRKFAAPSNAGMLLEIRSDGAQTIAPGSMHPDEELIEWVGNWEKGEPLKIVFEELDEICRRLAAACLILRHGWVSGKRDEVAVALCGLLLRAGWSNDDVNEWLEAIALAAGDEELDMRLKAEYQEQRLGNNQKVPGIPRLRSLLGPEICDQVLEWLEIKSVGVTEKLNQEIAVVNIKGKTAIMREVAEGLEFSSVKDARDWYANLKPIRSGGKEVPAFDSWFKDENRRAYSQILFDPSDTVHPAHVFNSWRGWPVTPAEGDCSMFLRHVRRNICNGDRNLAGLVINWLADAVQNPTKRPGVALILQSSSEGTGKSAFSEYVGAMFGRYGIIETDIEGMVKGFNSHYLNKLMVFGEDTTWGGNHSVNGKIKNLITCPKILIEPKGIPKFEADNFMRFILTTNERWAISVSETARRFIIIETRPVVTPGDKEERREFCKEMAAERDNGGAEALLHYLLNYEIDMEVQEIPVTQGMIENQIQTMMRDHPIRSWMFHCLLNGEFTRGAGFWDPKMTNFELQVSYERFLNHQRGNRISSNSELSPIGLGRHLKNLLPRTMIRYKSGSGINQKRGYKFADLDDCREEFNELYFGGNYDWTS